MCILSFWDSSCSGQGLSGLVSAAVAGTVVAAATSSDMPGPRGGDGLVHMVVVLCRSGAVSRHAPQRLRVRKGTGRQLELVCFNSIHSSTIGARLYRSAGRPRRMALPINLLGFFVRTFVSAVAVLIGLVLAAVAVPAMWVDRNIVQEDGFVAFTAPLGQGPGIPGAAGCGLRRQPRRGPDPRSADRTGHAHFGKRRTVPDPHARLPRRLDRNTPQKPPAEFRRPRCRPCRGRRRHRR